MYIPYGGGICPAFAKETLKKAMFSHVCMPCNVPDEKILQERRFLRYIPKGEDTGMTRRFSEAYLNWFIRVAPHRADSS